MESRGFGLWTRSCLLLALLGAQLCAARVLTYYPTPAPLGKDGAPIINLNPGQRLPDPPPSPYIFSEVCVVADATTLLGNASTVNGYLSSPFDWSPVVFTRNYTAPPIAQIKETVCNASSNLCIDGYEIDIVPADLDIGCPLGLTPHLTYNGTYPGPTFDVPIGRQAMLRFNNKLYASNVTYPSYYCTKNQGIPDTVHLHGSVSVSPYDGWAEDLSCPGQTKDHTYPNEHATTLWYHDHTINHTTDSTMYGLTGFYNMNGNTDNCSDPWNLGALTTYFLALSDKRLNSSCNYFYDPDNVDQFDFYGDLNLVSGTPWPVIHVDAEAVRLQMLGSANSRAFLVRLVDDFGNDLSSKICRVVKSDGGFARVPLNIPPTGMYLGVSERYEWVCNFEGLANSTMYLWNEYDPYRLNGAPYFCYSHLLAKIVVNSVAPANPAKFIFDGPIQTNIDNALSESDINTAIQAALANECTREFYFGICGGNGGTWCINGQDWFNFRIAAQDIGQNSWEVWCLEAGEGWFHPTHLHLVDSYLLARNDDINKLEPYEVFIPKDVYNLYSGTRLTILARFGPHQGEYMFHCHNTVHEDKIMLRSFVVNNSTLGRNQNSTLPNLISLQSVNNIYYEGLSQPESRPPTYDPANFTDALTQRLQEGAYRIFYPDSTQDSAALFNVTVNPYLFECQAAATSNTSAAISAAISPYGNTTVGCPWGINEKCYAPALPAIGTEF